MQQCSNDGGNVGVGRLDVTTSSTVEEVVTSK